MRQLGGNEPSVKAMASTLGLPTAVVMVVKGGDLRLSLNPASYVKSLGLNLKECSSGRYQGQLRITKRGSGTARQWLYMAVLRLIQKDEVVRAWYRQKVARDGGLKRKALVAVMRKVASALWYVARGEEFDSKKLFDVSRLNLAA
jgi:transposase